MTRQSYGSGDTNYIDFEYDSLDKVVKKSYNGNDSSSISYMYDPNGNLYRTEDKLWNMGTVYEYDLAGRINGITSRDRDTNKMQAYESIRYNDGKGTVKGNHPAVKKSAKKVVKSTMRKIAKEARIYGEDFVSTTAISWGTKEYTRRRVKYMVGA